MLCGDCMNCAYLLIESCSNGASRLLAKLCDDQWLAKIIAAVHVTVDPPSGEVELMLLACLQPRVWPKVDGAKIELGNGVISNKVTSLQAKPARFT